MCGFAGIVLPRNGDEGRTPGALAAAMGAAIAHRGPDDSHVWEDRDAGLALAFRRLAILDLTEAGRQPMESACGRYVIAFNGEIYNHRDLKARLSERIWRGHSDTEVLLAALAEWGIEATLDAVDGMFAFALWDRRERVLTLVRDPFGEKPLYWGHVDGAFVFASELSAIEALGARPAIDPAALSLFLRHRYVPAPYSILAGIGKLRPGEMLTLAAGGEPKLTQWWNAAEAALGTPAFTGTLDEAAEALDTLLGKIVAERLEADVPVGAFLSGGIDSSLISALAAQQAGRLATFTIGFDHDRFDETPFARKVAEHLGTDHHEQRLSGAGALDLVPRLAYIYSEPFADMSALPTSLLCAYARKHVVVALSGDGGDELFLGYGRYSTVPERIARARNRPAALAALGRLAANSGLMPARKARRLAEALETDPMAAFGRLTTAWPGGVPMAGSESPLFDFPLPGHSDLGTALSLVDCAHAMPDSLQVKTDRASMHVGLEVRAPLLSRRVAEFAWSLPAGLKLGPEGGKLVLKKVLGRHVPRALFERPKVGFEPPVGQWLRGPLRDWTEDLLAHSADLFDPKPIRQVWQAHLSGKSRTGDLWPVLMMLAWVRR